MAWKKQYPMSISLKIKTEVFFVKLTDIESVHPKRICHKCYCTNNNVNKRKKTTSLTLFSDWQLHNSNCVTCQMAEKLQKVATDTQSILKMKKVFLGRPGKNKCWTVAMFTSIKESLTPLYSLNENIDISELKNELNPYLEPCLCCMGNKMQKLPVTLKRCEQLFCFLCLVEEMKQNHFSHNPKKIFVMTT